MQVLRQDKVEDFDSQTVINFMQQHQMAYLSRDLIQHFRESNAEASDFENEILDQIESVLEKKEMTHMLRLGRKEVYFLFLCVPLVNYEQTVEHHMRAIHGAAGMIEST